MSLPELFEKIDEIRQQSSISAHYGVSEEEFDKIIKQMMCDLIMNDKKSDVIDKYFKNNSKIDNITKAKICAYLIATEQIKKMDN